jgi:CubicO group peptidase (beta-lactamase class C family)
VSLLEPRVIDAFTARYDDTSSRALGWDTPDGRSSAGDYFTASAFGHTGFTGTSLWIDPELDLWVVLLTNRVHPSRENQRHVEVRRALHDAVARAITDRLVAPRG